MATITTTATTLEEASDQIITVSNQLYSIMNGAADETVTTDNGEVSTIRKALVDNFYFLTPEDWSAGSTETVFNQLRSFTDEDGYVMLYFAPAATTSNPITMGVTPVDDDNWKPTPYHIATDAQALAGSGDNPVSASQIKLAAEQFGNFGTATTYTGDLDDLAISGSFVTTSATTNKPVDNYEFTINSMVSASDSNMRTQLAIAFDNNYLYTRRMNNDSDGWSTWYLGAGGAANGVLQISQYIEEDMTLADNDNALSINPTINSGVTLTIPEDALYVVLGSTN